MGQLQEQKAGPLVWGATGADGGGGAMGSGVPELGMLGTPKGGGGGVPIGAGGGGGAIAGIPDAGVLGSGEFHQRLGAEEV